MADDLCQKCRHPISEHTAAYENVPPFGPSPSPVQACRLCDCRLRSL